MYSEKEIWGERSEHMRGQKEMFPHGHDRFDEVE